MTQVAYASGFQSVRRFDALFQSRYRLTPSALRRRAADESGVESETISLTLGYRPPLAWKELLQFLEARATPGVELVEGNAYSRTVVVEGVSGWVRVQPAEREGKKVARLADKRSLRVEISTSLTPVLMPLSLGSVISLISMPIRAQLRPTREERIGGVGARASRFTRAGNHGWI